jgi:hypothetical protein
MDMTYRWYPIGTRNPFIREIKSHEDGTIVYDGYFYVDSKDLPVQRILSRYSEPTVDEAGNRHCSHISSMQVEIYEKISGEDTSFLGAEAEGDAKATCDVSGGTATVIDISGACADGESDDDLDICFFPTEITTLKYRVLKSDLNPLEFKMVEDHIRELTKAKEAEEIKQLMASAEAADE